MISMTAKSAAAAHPKTLLKGWIAATGGTDAGARRALGIAQATWSAYVNEHRVVPLYVLNSIEAHLALRQAAPAVFDRLLIQRGKRTL